VKKKTMPEGELVWGGEVFKAREGTRDFRYDKWVTG